LTVTEKSLVPGDVLFLNDTVMVPEGLAPRLAILIATASTDAAAGVNVELSDEAPAEDGTAAVVASLSFAAAVSVSAHVPAVAQFPLARHILISAIQMNPIS